MVIKEALQMVQVLVVVLPPRCLIEGISKQGWPLEMGRLVIFVVKCFVKIELTFRLIKCSTFQSPFFSRSFPRMSQVLSQGHIARILGPRVCVQSRAKASQEWRERLCRGLVVVFWFYLELLMLFVRFGGFYQHCPSPVSWPVQRCSFMPMSIKAPGDRQWRVHDGLMSALTWKQLSNLTADSQKMILFDKTVHFVMFLITLLLDEINLCL